jgi:hypothetical protein
MNLGRAILTVLILVLAATRASAQGTPPTPCQGAGPYSDFDFWVGEWDVFIGGDRRAGANRIEKVEQGCLLVEHWTGSAGGTGKSMNFYDPRGDAWRQLWVASGGTVIEIAGGLRDGSMVLEGTLTSPAGESQPFRGTWTPNPDGSVRQHFEISADEGRTWSTWFDGRYVRRASG